MTNHHPNCRFCGFQVGDTEGVTGCDSTARQRRELLAAARERRAPSKQNPGRPLTKAFEDWNTVKKLKVYRLESFSSCMCVCVDMVGRLCLR